MTESTNIVQGFHHLRKAQLNFEIVRDISHRTVKHLIDKICVKRIELIRTDFVTSIDFPQTVRDGIYTEWTSDILIVDNINNLASLMNPEQRALYEKIGEEIVKGKNVQLKYSLKTTTDD